MSFLGGSQLSGPRQTHHLHHRPSHPFFLELHTTQCFFFIEKKKIKKITAISISNSRKMASSEADVTEIANLLKSERFHRDTARWEMCRQAFHPDASKTYINVLWWVLGDLAVATSFVSGRLMQHENRPGTKAKSRIS